MVELIGKWFFVGFLVTMLAFLGRWVWAVVKTETTYRVWHARVFEFMRGSPHQAARSALYTEELARAKKHHVNALFMGDNPTDLYSVDFVNEVICQLKVMSVGQMLADYQEQADKAFERAQQTKETEDEERKPFEKKGWVTIDGEHVLLDDEY
jgi:hypothetical protein